MPRALIIKLGAIGDVVMAIPAAYELYRQGYAIDWVAGSAALPVLQLYPWIRVFEADEQNLVRGSLTQKLAAMRGIWRQLSGNSYDLCATLYYDWRYAALTFPVRAKRKIALSKSERSAAIIPGRHHADEYARILLQRPDGPVPAQLPPVRPERMPASPLAVGKRSRVVLTPGGARNLLRDDALRRWPVESYTELVKLLIGADLEVVLSGGPQDNWVSPSFADLPVIDTVGKYSLTETLALFDSADVVVTHDTGPLHLAGLTSAAVLALFGPVDPHGRLPHRANAIALWGGEGFACRPCYDGRDFAADCTDNQCIQQITPQDAFLHIRRLLEARVKADPLPPVVLEPSAWRKPIELLVNIEPPARPAAVEQRPRVPALFLDRDGVINEETDYLYRMEDVRWVDGIFPLVRTAATLGYKVVVVTNQAGIARGYYTVAQFEELMEWMRREFTSRGCSLDAVYFSPYHPKGTLPEFTREHEDRKPGPGMLLRAAEDLGLDLSQSILVGDRCTDIAAANAAGLRHAFLLRGTEGGPCARGGLAVDSLAAVEEWLRTEGMTAALR